jgi:tetratricopeptide (TPR) repeat protein
MKYTLAAGVTLMLAAFGHAVTTAQEGDGPRFTAANELIRPADFREWVFLTSGLGMTYSEPTGAPRTPNFTNVYVNPSSYRAFMKTGRWPDKTMFILEIRRSTSEGSINKGGHFQSSLAVIEASVKDEARYPGKWAYFDFGPAGKEMKDRVEALPTTARCYACHAEHGAVDNTFVQFYPTLLEVAKQKDIERGIAHETAGRDEAAIEEFSAAIKLDPRSAVGFERRATAWFRLGKFDRAGSDYTAAVFLDGKNAAALYGRGMTQRLDRFNPASTADADVAAAKAIQPGIAEEMARRGVK